MRNLGTIAGAVALAAAIGFAGTAGAEVSYSFDGDLVGYWHFDTNAADADAINGGSTATLGVMNGDATRSEIIPAIPNNSNSVTLDGTGDFVSVAHDAGLDVTGQYTISAWVQSDDLTGATHSPILNRGTDIELYIESKGPSGTEPLLPHVVSLHNRSGAIDWVRFDAPPLVAATFFHLALVYDGTNVTAYYDGVAAGVVESNGAVTMGVPADSDVGWSIGTASYGKFDGLLDDVRIYDSVLTAEQIQILATTFSVSKTLAAAEHIGDVSDTDIGENENWRFDMTVTVENFGPGDLEGVVAKDPLPGDIELGDHTSGDEAGTIACDPLDGGLILDPVVVTGTGSVDGVAKGRTDKCILTWTIGDLDDGDFEDMYLIVSTDLNPKGVRANFNTKWQEYTTADETYCINQEVVLTGTIVAGGTQESFITSSNGIEVPGAATGDVLDPLTFDTICDETIDLP